MRCFAGQGQCAWNLDTSPSFLPSFPPLSSLLPLLPFLLTSLSPPSPLSLPPSSLPSPLCLLLPFLLTSLPLPLLSPSLSLPSPSFFPLPFLFLPLQVSSFNWDHNDNFPQFSGCHALLPDGYMSMLSPLARGFDIQLDSVVKHVELLRREGDRGYTSVRLTDTRGNESIADRVRKPATGSENGAPPSFGPP